MLFGWNDILRSVEFFSLESYIVPLYSDEGSNVTLHGAWRHSNFMTQTWYYSWVTLHHSGGQIGYQLDIEPIDVTITGRLHSFFSTNQWRNYCKWLIRVELIWLSVYLHNFQSQELILKELPPKNQSLSRKAKFNDWQAFKGYRFCLDLLMILIIDSKPWEDYERCLFSSFILRHELVNQSINQVRYKYSYVRDYFLLIFLKLNETKVCSTYCSGSGLEEDFPHFDLSHTNRNLWRFAILLDCRRSHYAQVDTFFLAATQ